MALRGDTPLRAQRKTSHLSAQPRAALARLQHRAVFFLQCLASDVPEPPCPESSARGRPSSLPSRSWAAFSRALPPSLARSSAKTGGSSALSAHGGVRAAWGSVRGPCCRPVSSPPRSGTVLAPPPRPGPRPGRPMPFDPARGSAAAARAQTHRPSPTPRPPPPAAQDRRHPHHLRRLLLVADVDYRVHAPVESAHCPGH